jgi:hypothetical protein
MEHEEMDDLFEELFLILSIKKYQNSKSIFSKDQNIE